MYTLCSYCLTSSACGVESVQHWCPQKTHTQIENTNMNAAIPKKTSAFSLSDASKLLVALYFTQFVYSIEIFTFSSGTFYRLDVFNLV